MVICPNVRNMDPFGRSLWDKNGIPVLTYQHISILPINMNNKSFPHYPQSYSPDSVTNYGDNGDKGRRVQ